MSTATNSLVARASKLSVPAGVVATLALGTILIHHSQVHAAVVPGSPLDDHSVAALTSLDQAMEALAARVTPAVVNVAVTSREERSEEHGGPEERRGPEEELPPNLPPGLRQFFGQMGPGNRAPEVEHGIGSGVIISPEGYILTNNHVVQGAVQVKVTLHDRRLLNAKVVGVDKLTDLAVIKVDARDLPSIAWGDSTHLQPGQTVLAFGSPFGYLQFSVTRGIISAVDRPSPFADDPRKPGGFIQTDAAINPGNSGGPLVDARGELVGINTFIATNNGAFQGAGFAIPTQIARATAEQLIQHGKVDHGYLGISMNDVTPDNAHFFSLPEASGAIVAQVTPDSPAARGGVKTGDVIAQLNGEKITNGSSLQVQVSQLRPGSRIALGLIRDGKPLTVNLTVGEYHGSAERASADPEQASQSGKLGLAVADLTPGTRQQLELPPNLHGVAVQSVRPASPAEDAGLQPGDVILELDRRPLSSASDFVSGVHQSPAGKPILLLVWSKGNASYRTVRPDSPEQNG
ncbi:MAG TPA: Do family serine endopeptidase [Acidobacteriaceae bacterium]